MNNRVQIKEQARVLIRTGKCSPLMVSAIVTVIGMVLSEIATRLYAANPNYVQMMYELGLLDSPEVATTLPLSVINFGIILTSLVNTFLTIGFISFLMGIRKGREMGYSSLLDGLGIAGRLIWCSIQIGIRVFLWSCLLVIPGFIAIYRYRFAYYNLLGHPELSASGAIALSCRQTKGWKMELLVLDLSFLGWNLVSLLTAGAADIWVRPYTILSDLGYYEMACAAMNTEPPQDKKPPADRGDTPWEF